MKKNILLGIIMLVAIISTAGLVACDLQSDSEEYSYVSLKINPEVDFVVNESGEIVSYYCVNEDAEVLLSDVDLVGETIETAAEEVLDMAIEAGYVDVDTEGEEIEIVAISEDGTEDDVVCENIKNKLNLYFQNKGVFGKVSTETLESYQAQAEELDISVGQVKILMLAVDRSGLTLDELKDKSMKELMELVHEENGNKFQHKNGNTLNQQERQNLKTQKIATNQLKIQEHSEACEQNNATIAANISAWQNSAGNSNSTSNCDSE